MVISGGVDPGLNGCAVSLSLPALEIIGFLDFAPFVDESGTCLDARRLAPHLARLFARAQVITIERPAAMPAETGQGVASAFNFGQSCGIPYGICAGACPDARIYMPHPSVWKAAIGVPADKKICTARAAELFPASREIFYGFRGGCKDGRAEAALLAYFGRRYVKISRLL